MIRDLDAIGEVRFLPERRGKYRYLQIGRELRAVLFHGEDFDAHVDRVDRRGQRPFRRVVQGLPNCH